MSSRIKKDQLKLSLGQHGFGLLEVIIAASIIGILCLGMGSVAANMSRIQAQANLYSTLNTISSNLHRSILDSNAWRNTVASPANAIFNCIYTSTPCNKTASYPTPGSEDAYDAFNTVFDGNAPPGIIFDATSGNNGFTYAGLPCATFSTTMPGNDSCPISYHLRVAMFCSDFSATCVQPSLIIYGILQYHPGSWGISFPVNIARFSFTVARSSGAYNRNDSIRVEDTGPTSSTAPTGTCPATGVNRNLAITLDTGNNVVGAPSGGVVTLKPGGYVCSASATGGGVDGFSISLVGVPALPSPLISPMAFASSSSAPIGIQQARITDVIINQTVQFTLELKQYCQVAGTSGTAFGTPLNFTGVPNVYAGIYCRRVY